MPATKDVAPEERGLVSRIGPVEIDWPRTLGYYAGIGLAVGFELIDPPIGIFIGAIPFFKMLSRPGLPQPVRFVSQVLDGASRPVGGDSERSIRLTTADAPRRSMRGEARQLADAFRDRRAGANGRRVRRPVAEMPAEE